MLRRTLRNLPLIFTKNQLFSTSAITWKKAAPAASSPRLENTNRKEITQQLDLALEKFGEKIREARAQALSTEKFQNLSVDLGGGAHSLLKSISTIALRGNKVSIVAFDPKQVKRIQTAIVSELNIPAELSSRDEQTLSVNLPPQSEARKLAVAKNIKEAYESFRNQSDNRNSLASIRAKHLNPLKKAATKTSGVSKDDVKRQTQEIEQLVKVYAGKLQDMLRASQ